MIPPRMKHGEEALYGIVRISIALAGLFVLMATVSSYLLMPGLYYDEAPTPPLRDRLPAITLGLGIGVLLCIPNRWTRDGVLFWTRLGVYVLLAIFLLWRAVEGILSGMSGGKSWAIFPVSLVIACLGVALPLCLLWSRRIGRVR